MRDLELELATTMARGFDSNGRPQEGFYNLTRRMEYEEEDQFDVDLTILDFLVYKATATVFDWQARANKWDSDLPNALVTMTAEWRSFMSQKHRGSRSSNLPAFRLQLLQFVLLITHRYHPIQTWTNEGSLQKLRLRNSARSERWSKAHASDTPHQSARRISGNELDFAREQRVSELNLPSSCHIGMLNDPDRPSLHDLLPLFIELTAARTNLGDEWQPTSDWFDLAGQFMLQAVVDQYLRTGQCPTETFTSIFAFGTLTAEPEEGDGAAVRATQSLFCREDSPQEELPEWTASRRRYIREANDIYTLERIEGRHSYVKFERSLLSFLQHLHDSTIKPDLIQVEQGRINIDGNELSEAESRDMIKRMRL